MILDIWIVLCGCFVAGLGNGFLASMLGHHLKQFHLSVSEIGMVFVVSPLAYTTAAPVWGRLVNKYVSPRFLLTLGLALRIICLLLIGPLPISYLKPSLKLIIAGTIIQGISMGSLFTGGLMDLIRLGKEHSSEGDAAITGLMGSLWGMTFSAGSFIGPSISGLLIDVIGFRWESFTLSVLNLLTLILISSITLHNKITFREEAKTDSVT